MGVLSTHVIPTGTWFLWQGVIDQPSNAIGPGFAMSSNKYKCTPSIEQGHKCPLGFSCTANLCQQCNGWGGPSTIAPTPHPTGTSTI